MPKYKHFNVTAIGDVTVVRFRGPQPAEGNNEFGTELHSLVESNNRQKLLLNFSMVKFLDGVILSRLITLNKKLTAKGGEMRISNMSPDCRKVFAITKLDLYFDIQEDEADALAAFRSS